MPYDLLNDSVKGFVKPNAPIDEFLTFKALKIFTVYPEYLLAMKLMSSRYETNDYEDANFLCRKLGVKTSKDLEELLMDYYSPKEILPRVQ